MLGPNREHAMLVARRAQMAGATVLGSQILESVASHGGRCCFVTDRAFTETNLRPDGKPWHPASVRRQRAKLVKKGFLISERVMPQETPKDAKYPSPQGTTNKWVRYREIGMRSPMNRETRREYQRQITQAARDAKAEREAKAREYIERQVTRSSAAVVPQVIAQLLEKRELPLPPRRPLAEPAPPPTRDDRSREERAADAKRRLAEFDAQDPQQRKRGPP